jgi:uncharacterized protein (TIGR03437 family)
VTITQLTCHGRFTWLACGCFVLLACGWVLISLPIATPPLAKLQSASAAQQTRVDEAFGKLPLSFEINQGQATAPIRFLAHLAAGSLYLTPHEVVFELPRPAQAPTSVRLKLKNANPMPQLVGEVELPGKHHYLLGQHAAQWRSNIPTYARVRYQAIYPGIDLVWYGKQTQVEYDFIIAPGAKPRAIKLALEGVARARLDSNGNLLLQTPAGELRQPKPLIYQEVAGVRRPIAGGYQLSASNELSFTIGAYDHSHPLVIDPVLNYLAAIWPTLQIAVDGAGSAYLARALEVNGVAGLGVTKLNAAGTAVLYQTLIAEGANIKDLAVDAAGSAHLLCDVTSLTFPGVEQVDLEGLQKSTDGATNWAASGRGIASTILKVIPDPSTPQRLFAQGSHVNGGLIYRSDDGGRSWRLISQNLLEATLLAVLPGNPITLLARTRTQLLSSRDLGTSWQETALKQPNLAGLEFEPSDTSVLYAIAENVVQKSSDGGQTWVSSQTGLPAAFYPSQIVPDPTTRGQVYLWLQTESNSITERQIYRSTNAGASWQLMLKFAFAERRILTLAVSPKNGTLYVGTNRGLLKSSDGGRTVQPAGLAEIYIQALALDPVDPATLYASTPYRCCDLSPAGGPQLGGVHKTTDGGTTWLPLNNSFQNKFVASLVLDPFAPTTVYASVPTGGIRGVYVVKLNPQGSQMAYSVPVADGRSVALALDAVGDVYAIGVGRPRRNQFFAPAEQGENSFVVKLNGQNQNFAYSGVWPGQVGAAAADAAGRLALTGQIYSTPAFIARNGFQTQSAGNGDAYIQLLDLRQSGEAALLYATYFGGQGNDAGQAIGWDAQGGVYVAGTTESTDFPVTPATRLGPPRIGSSFLAHFNPAQTAAASLNWSARLPNGFSAMGVADSGITYFAGTTGGPLPTTPGAWQPAFVGGSCPLFRCNCELMFGFCPARCGTTPIPNACTDGYLFSVAPNGTALLYATYVGSAASRNESITDLALDANGNVYLVGEGDLAATAGALQETGSQGFIAKFTLPPRNTAANILSAANYSGPELARESLAVAFLEAAGAGAEGLTASVRDSTGVERSAPVFFSGAGQVNLQIPPGSQNGSAEVFITSNRATIASGAVRLVDVAPGIFTANASGRGLPAAVVLRVKADGASAYENILRYDAQQRPVPVPIDLGPEAGNATDQVLLVLFGTGWRGRSAETNVRVSIGGVDAPVLYAGLQPTLTGLDQINVRLPRTLVGRGEVDVVLTVDGRLANTVRISFK